MILKIINFIKFSEISHFFVAGTFEETLAI